MDRVSTLGLNTTMMNNVMQLEVTLANARVQESSGIVSSTYDGYGASAGRLIGLQSDVAQAQTWSNSAQLANQRVQSAYSAVGNMVSLITTLRTNIGAALGSGNPNITGQGSGTVQDLVGQMNAQFNGDYLFGGNNTTTAPVDMTGYPTVTGYPTSPTTPPTTYYKGDSGTQSIRVSGQQTISYGVLANNNGFAEALCAAQMVAQQSNPPNQSQLQAAYDLAGQALTDLGDAQSNLGSTSQRLQEVQQNQSSYISLSTTMISNISNVDVAQVAVQVSQYQTQLQASFSAVAGSMKLNLASFL
ncbi:MAG: flagellin [Magnetospirillum sp.]|nr:flagellin [Magnetospirillum sp.]